MTLAFIRKLIKVLPIISLVAKVAELGVDWYTERLSVKVGHHTDTELPKVEPPKLKEIEIIPASEVKIIVLPKEST